MDQTVYSPVYSEKKNIFGHHFVFQYVQHYCFGSSSFVESMIFINILKKKKKKKKEEEEEEMQIGRFVPFLGLKFEFLRVSGILAAILDFAIEI